MAIGLASVALFLVASCGEEGSPPVGGPEFESGPPVAVTIRSDMVGRGGPDVTYKRGMVAGGNGGFVSNAANRASVDVAVVTKMAIVNGVRNLYKEPSLGEFYIEDGVYKHRQSDAYISMLEYVLDHELELINQIGGTPDNSSPSLYPLATEYLDTDLDYVPLPTSGASMTAFQRNFAQWAIAADTAAGGPSYHSIWIAHQEPTHTLGYIDGVGDDAAKETNIKRFIDYWKPIAEDLRAAGARVGGIQLNSDNTKFYQYAVAYLVQQNVRLDFLTFQLYRWGEVPDETSTSSTAFEAAVDSLETYNQQMGTDARIIVNRGGWYKECCSGNKQQAISTSAGMIYYLRGERLFMDHADKVYAHLYDDQHTDLELLEFKITTWLNSIDTIERRPLTELPDGVDGFVLSANGSAMYAAVWNTSLSEYDLILELDNSAFSPAATLTVQKASGQTMTSVTDVVWDGTEGTIETLNVGTNEILLIALQE